MQPVIQLCRCEKTAHDHHDRDKPGGRIKVDDEGEGGDKEEYVHVVIHEFAAEFIGGDGHEGDSCGSECVLNV